MAACEMYLSPVQHRAKMVEVLLEAGALPSLVDDQGCVVLHLAAHCDADDAIEVLAAAAPETLNHADLCGETPLCAAAKEGRTFVAWGGGE